MRAAGLGLGFILSLTGEGTVKRMAWLNATEDTILHECYPSQCRRHARWLRLVIFVRAISDIYFIRHELSRLKKLE